MFFLFKPARVRCFSCREVGYSRASRGYITLFFVFLGFALANLGVHSGHHFRSMQLSMRGRGGVGGGLLFLLAAIWVLFTREAHRCRACGKGFLERL